MGRFGEAKEIAQKVKADTGITAKYESNRDNYATVLQTKITGGNPPDVAILPGIGFLRRFAKDGSIKKISDLGIDPASLPAHDGLEARAGSIKLGLADEPAGRRDLPQGPRAAGRPARRRSASKRRAFSSATLMLFASV